jgi:hypothetical protein
MKVGNPLKGKGHRELNCDLYETCLDLAAKNNWKAFNCEGCLKDKLTNPEIEKHVDIKLCACGNPVIHANSRLCASCMGKLAHKKKKAPEKPVKPPKTKTEGCKPQKSTKPVQRQAGEICTVDFEEYVSVLSDIKKLAKEEVRPLNYQIIHMLKEQLKIKNPPKGISPI